MKIWRLTFILALFFTIEARGVSSSLTPTCKAWLVQSIPTDMPELRRVPGVLSSGDVMLWLAGNASKSLDLTVQNWQLMAQPENPDSGDYGFTPFEIAHFGAATGAAVFQSLEKAADRGISLRIVQHSGFFPDFVSESARLAAGRPSVQNRTLLMEEWWGSGVVHSKVWIVDGKHFYIGSANNDWKSLTQVKELGIYVTDCPHIATDLKQYFNNLWTLTMLNSSHWTRQFYDQQWQVVRKVPCWSHFLPLNERCSSPIPSSVYTSHIVGYPYLANPSMFNLILDTPATGSKELTSSKAYLSFAPPELLFKSHQSDEQGWVETILSVPINGTVRMNTMDWLGQSQYAERTIFWTALSSAIGKVVLSKGARVKVLVANWKYAIKGQIDYLQYLSFINRLCKVSPTNNCLGVEVKLYEVPGFDSTGAAKSQNGELTGTKFPDYTRVNHGKYAVSNVRAHIGTSNLIWDYFYSTAGVSFGTYDENVVSQLVEVFEADWESTYAVPLEDFTGICEA